MDFIVTFPPAGGKLSLTACRTGLDHDAAVSAVLRAPLCACMSALHGTTLCTERSCGPNVVPPGTGRPAPGGPREPPGFSDNAQYFRSTSERPWQLLKAWSGQQWLHALSPSQTPPLRAHDSTLQSKDNAQKALTTCHQARHMLVSISSPR